LLRNPVALPCGRVLCKTCQPESRPREGVSFPGTPERLLGFKCPFPECGIEHALADCATDVVLESIMDRGRTEMEKRTEEEGSTGEDDAQALRSFEKALLSNYALAGAGNLKYDDPGVETSLARRESGNSAADFMPVDVSVSSGLLTPEPTPERSIRPL